MIPFKPGKPFTVIVQYPKTSDHIWNPITTKPTENGDYRVVGLLADFTGDWQMENQLVNLLNDADEDCHYSLCVAEIDFQTIQAFFYAYCYFTVGIYLSDAKRHFLGAWQTLVRKLRFANRSKTAD